MIYALENQRYEPHPTHYVQSATPHDMDALKAEFSQRYWLHRYPDCPCFIAWNEGDGLSEADCNKARRADAARWSEFGYDWVGAHAREIAAYDWPPRDWDITHAFAAWLVAVHGFEHVAVEVVNLAHPVVD